MITAAEKEAAEIVKKSEEFAQIQRTALEEQKEELRARKQEITQTEQKLSEKDTRLEQKLEDIEKRQNALRDKTEQIEKKEREIDEAKASVESRLESIARLSQDEAREMLMKYTEERYEKDLLAVMEKKRKDFQLREKEIAREVLIKSIQQYSGDVTGEMTQTMVKLENDDLKGKLIGKEGRNIIAFEKATGVSLIIDDTPDNVFISSFDLFRRYIAKKSLEELVEDKRIQPARIEEIVEKNQADADKLIYELGTKTINEMGLSGIPEEIVPLVGKFRFRTSYGQNILMHSKEVAYIAEAIAKLIGADAALALKGGLLHDLGKAMDHDVEGTHPEIGGRIARKYGLDERIVNIIE